MKIRGLFSLLVILVLLTGLILWPQIDLIVAGWFYVPGEGFILADQPLLVDLHWASYYGARAMGIVLTTLFAITALRRKAIWTISSKGWLFLLLALMIGPVLVANVVMKDHWGRARPREVTEFGGNADFSPPWIPQLYHHKNGSFVAGDPAFGFYLSSFAYVVPLPKKRKKRNLSRSLFWGGISSGALSGVARIVMGAHFFSDVLFAAFFMLAASAALHAAMYGGKVTARFWRHWLFADSKKQVTED